MKWSEIGPNAPTQRSSSKFLEWLPLACGTEGEAMTDEGSGGLRPRHRRTRGRCALVTLSS